MATQHNHTNFSPRDDELQTKTCSGLFRVRLVSYSSARSTDALDTLQTDLKSTVWKTIRYFGPVLKGSRATTKGVRGE